MYFQELQSLTKTINSSELIGLLPAFDEYLFSSIRRKRQQVIPIQLAKKLGTTEGLATVLLMLADEAGLLSPRYQVRCKESNIHLATFSSLDEIPETVFCPEHNRDHSDDEYYVELVFEFNEHAISEANVQPN